MTTREINIGDTTYGIEIETVVPNTTIERTGMRIGSYHHGIQVPFLPTGWKAESDSSIRAPFGKRGCEIVSPKLKGQEGLRQIIEVLRILRENGFAVNETTGIHISLNFDRTNPAILLSKLISVTAYAETALYAASGTKRRENGHYCQPFRKYGNVKEAKKFLDNSRYQALNITNLNRGQDRVEFRVFSGSLQETKIIGWIQICLGLLERAMTTHRLPLWAPKPTVGGWKKKGAGASEMERLFGFLGWSEGTRRQKGKSFGWIADGLTTQETVKSELRRLAQKYDNEA